MADIDYYRGRLDRRQQILDERGGDLRAASVEAHTLGQALRTQAAVAADGAGCGSAGRADRAARPTACR